VAEKTFTPEELRPLWYGRFMTQHYTLRVPWQSEFKTHPPSKVTALVRFTDLLTGQSFDAEQSIDLAISSTGKDSGAKPSPAAKP
jgi:hypothetical protein